MSYLPLNPENSLFEAEDDIIDAAREMFWNFHYPFYNDSESDKIYFEKYFLRHYYMHEIGQETVGLFKNRLQSKLYDIMPKIQRIWETERMVFDPLNDYSELREYTTEDTGEQTNNVSSTRNDTSSAESSSASQTQDKVFANDTPQGPLEDVDSGKYLSSYTSRPSESSSSDSSSGNTSSNVENHGADTIHNIQTHRETISGKRGQSSYMKLIREYRELAVNVNGLICSECRDMFMYIM